MSRADLARASSLTRPTVSTLIDQLVAEGIVAELGISPEARVGKPATLVGVNPEAFYVITLNLSLTGRFIGALVNIRGAVIRRAEVALRGATGEDAILLVLQLAEKLARAANVRVLGIGVGSPGIVGPDGAVREAPNLGWFNVPLAQRLSHYFAMPVHVGNDANTAALGVHTFRDTTAPDLMVVTIRQGVGSGLIIGGALLEGETGAAGEIGHVTVDEDGEPCRCGRYGCLELEIAEPFLRQRMNATDENQAHVVLHDAGNALGTVLSPIISALNLRDVVLVGASDIVEGPFIESVRSSVRRRTMPVVSQNLDVRTVAGPDDLVLLGAAVLVLSGELGIS
jgi:predicted NBD/HSP70 family sugar kinase